MIKPENLGHLHLVYYFTVLLMAYTKPRNNQKRPKTSQNNPTRTNTTQNELKQSKGRPTMAQNNP